MSAKIKLQRRGTKKRPFYRVVIQDESAAPISNVIEILGTYNPLKDTAEFIVDKERTLDWLSKGATPTDKVRLLLGKAGIMEPVDLNSLHKKKSKAEIKAAAEAKPEEAKAESASAEAPPAGEAGTADKEPKAEEPKVEETK
ncbi:MAG: 30S ribosomal protein S16 [bacterium]